MSKNAPTVGRQKKRHPSQLEPACLKKNKRGSSRSWWISVSSRTFRPPERGPCGVVQNSRPLAPDRTLIVGEQTVPEPEIPAGRGCQWNGTSLAKSEPDLVSYPNGVPVVDSIPPTDVDLEIRAARAQAAVVRSLLDELDDALPPSGCTRVRSIFAAQAAEEIAHLGERLLQLASRISMNRAA